MLQQRLYTFPVGAGQVIPVREVQSPVVLRLKMVDVMSLGVGSIWTDAHSTRDYQMQPIR